jgi:predicted dehydrogenase
MVNYAFREVEPELRVVGIVDPDEQGARARLAEQDRDGVVFYATLDEMVRGGRLDAIAIGTRCNLHTPYAIEAMKYDLPIFLEKPVSNSMEQAIELEKAFEKAKCEVVVSFPLRVSPLCVLAKERLGAGDVGTPEHVLAVNYVPYGTGYFDGQYREFEITQGLFVQKTTHDFDYLMFLMGSSVTRVAAMASWGRIFGGSKPAGLVCSECDEADSCLESPKNRIRNLSGGTKRDHPCLFSEDIGTPETGMNEDSSSALIEFASGAKGVYTQVFYSRRDAAARGAVVSGYKGTLDFDWYRNDMKIVHHHAPFTETIRPAEGMSHFGGDLELAYNFIDVVKGKAKSRTPIWAGIQSVYACLAAKESAETGRFVEVRQVGHGG